MTGFGSRLLSWLISGAVFLALGAGWFLLVAWVFNASGLRALLRQQDNSDFWIAVTAICFALLAIPVFIAHGRIMKRIRARMGSG